MYPFLGRPQEVKNFRPESRNVAVVSIVTRFSAITNVIVATVTHGEANAVVLTRVGTATCVHEAKLPTWPYEYGHLKKALSCSSKTWELNPDWSHLNNYSSFQKFMVLDGEICQKKQCFIPIFHQQWTNNTTINTFIGKIVTVKCTHVVYFWSKW